MFVESDGVESSAGKSNSTGGEEVAVCARSGPEYVGKVLACERDGVGATEDSPEGEAITSRVEARSSSVSELLSKSIALASRSFAGRSFAGSEGGGKFSNWSFLAASTKSLCPCWRQHLNIATTRKLLSSHALSAVKHLQAPLSLIGACRENLDWRYAALILLRLCWRSSRTGRRGMIPGKDKRLRNKTPRRKKPI